LRSSPMGSPSCLTPTVQQVLGGLEVIASNCVSLRKLVLIKWNRSRKAATSAGGDGKIQPRNDEPADAIIYDTKSSSIQLSMA
jgi:hypothetical protein